MQREADAMRTSAPEAVRMGMFTIAISERNTTALFGAGAIDAIEDSAILEGEARRHKDFPEIVGRAARLTGNRIGRFGWKGQKANLRDFVLTACAVEVGLHVPDEPLACHAVGMANRDRAPVDVEPVVGNAELIATVEHLHGEGFV